MKRVSSHQRKNSVLLMVFVLCFTLLANTGPVSASMEPKNQTGQTLVIKNATIVDVHSGKLKPNQSIVVTNNKITKIEHSDKVSIPDKAQSFDATGQYIIPGLWDMHVHLSTQNSEHEYAFPLLLDNGVTGVRDMGAALENIDLWNKSIKNGAPAPRIVYAGQTLNKLPGNGIPPHMLSLNTEEDARNAVRKMVDKGADHIKIYSNLPEMLTKAVFDEAKKYKIPVVGHLPNQVTAAEASEMGMKSMEHLVGLFIATSSIEKELLGDPKLEEFNSLIEAQNKAFIMYDPQRAEKLFQTFIKNKTWQVPTLVALKNPSCKDIDLRAKYVPTQYQEQWIQIIKEIKESQEMYSTYSLNCVKLTGRMNAAGVPLLAGTDSVFGVPNMIFGISLHDELELLVKAGLSPLQALQAATINPAKYLEREKDLGSVEEGKLADLVVLKANPLANIKNTTLISAVVLDGKLMEKAELDKSIKTYDLVKAPNSAPQLYPARSISEESGAEVNWDGKSMTVTITKKANTLQFKVNDAAYIWNEKTYKLDAPIQCKNGGCQIPYEIVGIIQSWQ